MTFSRQLLYLLMTVILLLLIVSLTISFFNTRQFVENQLSSHAQDAATSLGLSASSAMRDGDQVIVRSLVDAMFHAGDYQEVIVYDVHGEELIKRRLDVKVDGIPAWFINLVPLSLPIGESVVMDGWAQAGKVQISSHPGYAYRQLWEALIDTFKWFVISAVVVLVFSLLRLRRVLYPLKQVEDQANAISRREFAVVEPLPATQELKRIVQAMNQLGSKVKQMLAESDELAQQLRDQAHRDNVTGLANRQHFTEILDHRIESTEQMQQGILALIQLKDFKKYNDTHGFAAGDKLLSLTGEVLEAAVSDLEKVHVAHFAGANFAVLVEDLGRPDDQRLAKMIAAALASIPNLIDEPLLDIGHVGAACFTGEQTATELLSMADSALREAQTDSANGWSVYAEPLTQSGLTRTATQWRELLNMGLAQDWLVVQRQPVLNTGNESLVHEEVYVRLAEQGDTSKLLNAGAFMPMVQNLGLSTQIDKRVIEKVLNILDVEQEGLLAVNLSPLSIDDQDFIEWLKVTLSEHQDSASRLILEFPEYGIVKKIEQLQQLQASLKPYAVKYSLDHFGRGFTSFAYLQSIQVDYLKIDGSYLFDLESSSENRFFVQALTEIAHGLDILVVAESVETENVWNLLPSLKVDAGQGYYLAKPS